MTALPSPPTVYTPPPPFHWTWRFFWVGLLDYMRERRSNESRGLPASGKGSPSATAFALGGLFVFFTVAFLVAHLAPAAASASGSYASSVVTLVSGAIVLVAVFLAVWLPYTWSRRSWRFAQRMAIRGWQIETGQRVSIPRIV